VTAAASGTAAEPNSRRLSPRRRARRIRAVQYVLIGAVAALLALAANWSQIGDAFFRPALIKSTMTHGIGHALLNTLVYAAGGFLLGLVAGTVLALMRLSQVAVYRWLATAYIEFFRGLPALIVFIALSLLPLAFSGMMIPFDPYGTVWLALGIVGSAYMAETIRGGIQAVPRGQVEAARSLGMSAMSAMRKIVLPQAFRIMIPPLTNELIGLVKDSSLVYIVGVASTGFELTKFGRNEANTTANITPLVVAAFGYLIITLPLSVLVRRLERKTATTR
jgi:polar amino acid transport system permease protein